MLGGVGRNINGVAFDILAFENPLGERIFEPLLNDPLERASGRTADRSLSSASSVFTSSDTVEGG